MSNWDLILGLHSHGLGVLHRLAHLLASSFSWLVIAVVYHKDGIGITIVSTNWVDFETRSEAQGLSLWDFASHNTMIWHLAQCDVWTVPFNYKGFLKIGGGIEFVLRQQLNHLTLFCFYFRHIKQLLMMLQYLNLNYHWNRKGRLIQYFAPQQWVWIGLVISD